MHSNSIFFIPNKRLTIFAFLLALFSRSVAFHPSSLTMVSTGRTLLPRTSKRPGSIPEDPKACLKKPKPEKIKKTSAKLPKHPSPSTPHLAKPSAPSRSPKKTLYAYSATDAASNTIPLLNLTGLISAKLVQRPSRRNRSPYVADVLIQDDDEGGNETKQQQQPVLREAICHVPNLDMGGKCVPEATLLVKRARDRKGNVVGRDAVNPTHGTPKCEVHAQLLRVDETSLGYEPACWVGAHPSLGETIAEQLLLRNSLPLPAVESIQREVRNVAGTDMRADFVIQFVDKSQLPCVMEVKTVVDTDFAKGRIPVTAEKVTRKRCVFVSDQEPYRRAGIFPWGQSNQKGPNGEKVVSARAIKHVRELTSIAEGRRKGPEGEAYQAAVLFVVIRKDAEYFRANHEACPSFCKYLKEAQDAGVTILAKRVDWGDTEDTIGQCVEGPLLDVEWPASH